MSSSADLDRTLAAMQAHGWEIVRLRGKKPIGKHWEITKDPDEVARWVAGGDNIGLVCHERTGVAVLDPDQMLPWADMVDQLGQPCAPWVITGSGRLHYYITWTDGLPAKLTWGLDEHGKHPVIGELQRGNTIRGRSEGQQLVVLPPSRHPTTGLAYRWITESLGFLCEPIDPSGPLPSLPGIWLAYIRSAAYADS
jgi:hypothetical protein